MNILPLLEHLRPRLRRHFARILQSLLRRQPPVLLMHHRLAHFPSTRSMIFNPLAGPRNRLAPPIRVCVKHAEIDIRQRKLVVKVPAVVAVVESVGVAGDVEAAFAAPRH